MSFKYLIPTMGVMAALMSACVPFTPYDPNAAGGQHVDPSATPEGSELIGSEEQERIRLAQEEAARNNPDGSTDQPEGTNPTEGGGISESTGGSDYRRATLIPGKEGFVFNPFTNNPVDVRGIPSGTLVRDPQDPNKDHKFRVP